jgi:hypothetical protein
MPLDGRFSYTAIPISSDSSLIDYICHAFALIENPKRWVQDACACTRTDR